MTADLTSFPAGETKIILQGPAGPLEALTSEPQNPKNIIAIICHPHPLFGGTMHNKVVYTLARAFKEMALRTVRFNFRGVGESDGSYGEGVGETEDLFAVIQWAQQVCPNAEIWLAGFSFGAYVSARAASQNSSIAQLVSIAPPVQSFDFRALAVPKCPWLVIQGEEDEIVAPQAVYDWSETVVPQPQLIRIPQASHFFHGKLIELRQTLQSVLQNR